MPNYNPSQGGSGGGGIDFGAFGAVIGVVGRYCSNRRS